MVSKKLIKQVIKNVLRESNQRLIDSIQLLINQFLDDLNIESEDWGLGEMDYLRELEDIKDIKVSYIDDNDGLVVYVDIYTYNVRYDFYLILEEISGRLDEWFSGIEIKVNEILINQKDFGPGIDW
jgi:hypothetical protein